MTASGITATDELVAAFAQAEQNNVRFLKLSIRSEQLVLDTTIPISGAFTSDLDALHTILEDAVPAYVLARLDGDKQEYLFISYVPDTAKVREKMLYASTRAAVTKSLGDHKFTDSLFANSKTDLTPESYAAHRKHVMAASPMSAREAEMAALRAAERAAGDDVPRGTSARSSHVDHTIGLAWSDEIEHDLRDLGAAEDSKLLLLSIDTATETLTKVAYDDVDIGSLSTRLPASEPAFAVFAWQQSINGESRRDIVFVYSCPSSSPVKHRMLYSSGVGVLIHQIKALGIPVAKRIETSDASELTAEYLRESLGIDTGGSGPAPTAAQENRAFARPKGPARKR